jgi:hypothetical protein
MEQAAYTPVALSTSLPQYIDLHNRRLSRLAALLARTQRLTTRVVSAAATLTEADDVVGADTSSAGFTITLPLAASVPGKTYHIKLYAGTNTVTVAAAGSDTIDGAATKAWNTALAAFTFASVRTSGSTWVWWLL